MKKLLILGAGTAGTMVANRMQRLLDADEWNITIVDQHATHYYQPGFLFIPLTWLKKRIATLPSSALKAIWIWPTPRWSWAGRRWATVST